MRKKIFRPLAVIFLFIFILNYDSAFGKNYKWLKISGNWRIDGNKKILIEDRGYSRDLGYSELINYNSIITYKYIPAYSGIRFNTAFFSSKKEKTVEEMFFFSMKKNFREFYAFKLTGNRKGFYKISFIKSTIRDKTKKKSAKWNYKISVLKEIPYKLEYNKKYGINIKFNKNIVSLYIDREKILEYETDENTGAGKIGFSNRNGAIVISSLKVLHETETAFSDDFSEDTIARTRVHFIRKK